MPAVLPYVAPLFAAAALCSVFVVVAVPHRALPGVRWFMLFMAVMVVWTLGYAGEILAPTLDGKVLAARLQYLAIAFVGISWLAFISEYAGLTWWTGRTIALGMVIPVATLALVWTNELHGLVWAGVVPARGPGYTVLDVSWGPWFWVIAGYSHLCLLVALALLGRIALVHSGPFRRQAAYLLLGSLPPIAGNAIYLSGASTLDLTVFGFAVSGVLAGWAILRWRLLSVGPVARDTLVEGMAEPVLVLDTRGRVVDANPAALSVLGTTADRLVGWEAPSVLGAFDPGPLQGEGRRFTVSSQDGSRSWDCEVRPLVDRRGGRRGWTLLLHDVTLRLAEAEALRRAREAAEETALAQRAFLANMNHELRTPLNGVMGMLQLLLQSDLTAEQKGFAATAHGSAEELLRLVDKVLDLSAAHAGRLELNVAPFDPSATLRRAVEAFQEPAAAKGVALRLEIAPGIPSSAVGDAFRITQVTASLVDNAVKFTDRGAVEVAVSAAPRTDGWALRVEVRDTGIGIEPAHLPTVFDGFVQADASYTRRHGGAGLGLALARRLVERLGGTIHAASEAGRGSTFGFEVPLQAPAGRG